MCADGLAFSSEAGSVSYEAWRRGGDRIDDVTELLDLDEDIVSITELPDPDLGVNSTIEQHSMRLYHDAPHVRHFGRAVDVDQAFKILKEGDDRRIRPRVHPNQRAATLFSFALGRPPVTNS